MDIDIDRYIQMCEKMYRYIYNMFIDGQVADLGHRGPGGYIG